MKFTILIDPTSVTIITMYLVCLNHAPDCRRRFFEKIMQFHYMTYMATPSQKTPAQGVMKFTILVDPTASLVIISEYLLCSMPGGREEDFF